MAGVVSPAAALCCSSALFAASFSFLRAFSRAFFSSLLSFGFLPPSATAPSHHTSLPHTFCTAGLHSKQRWYQAASLGTDCSRSVASSTCKQTRRSTDDQACILLHAVLVRSNLSGCSASALFGRDQGERVQEVTPFRMPDEGRPLQQCLLATPCCQLGTPSAATSPRAAPST